MRKILIAFLSLFTILGLALSVNYVKADGGVVETVDGASIRLTNPQGLRFTGQVTGEFTGTLIEYGFLLSKGDYTKEQMVQLLAQNKAAFYPVGTELDEGKKFYLSIVNIPDSAFEQDITALACVRIDGNITYSTASTARNIKEVATAAAADPGYVANAFIDDIVAKATPSTFNLNGGSWVYPYKFTITGDADAAYAIGSGYTINVASQSHYDNACNGYWDRLYVNYDEALGLYDIIAKGAAPANYDYVIAVHSACTDIASRTQLTGLMGQADYLDYYLKMDLPTTHSNKNVNIEVVASNNPDLLNGNKLFLGNGDTLPTVQKEYYTFGGWYDNAGLIGDPIATKVGDAAETFYAKLTANQYTLTFDLQDGSSTESTDPVNFTVESAAIVLPLESTMSREDYEFEGWNTSADGTGSYLTEIPAGSHANITVYAIWSPVIPVVVNLTGAQLTALAAANPTKVVKPEFTSGKFTIAGNTYKVGEELYPNITTALAAASINDVIFVFASNYAENLTVTTPNNVKLIGEDGATINGYVNATSAIDGLTDKFFNLSTPLISLIKSTLALGTNSCQFSSFNILRLTSVPDKCSLS